MTARIRTPFSMLIKPTGAACNLDCSYCFFLSKEVLWDSDGQSMSEETLDELLSKYLEAQPDGEVIIGWQGGEPTMRGLDFFVKAVELGKKYARSGQQVSHSIQTNGTLLDDAWGEFLAREKFLVGISIDGPEEMHNQYRLNKGGRGSYDMVKRGWEVLQRHRVDVNILCTVNQANQDYPLEVYRHFRDDLGAEYLQFIPIVERVETGREAVAEAGWRTDDGNFTLYTVAGDQVTSRTVDPLKFGTFLSTIFDEWVTRDVGTIFVQHFDTTLGARVGQYSLCVHAPECGRALATEHNGEVYSCDHYVEPDYKLGNVGDTDFRDMLLTPVQRKFGRDKLTTLPQQCLNCDVRWACNGGCPKDRLATTADGEPGLNYLCAGYKHFFRHVTPGINTMAHLLSAQRPASDIMTLVNGSSGKH